MLKGLVLLLAIGGLCATFPCAVSADEALVRDETGAQQLGWKLGLQAWTFHDLTLFDMLDRVKALNLHYVEFYPGQKLDKDGGRFDHNAPVEMRALVKERLKQLGITVMNYGVVGLGTNEAEDRTVFAFAKDMGIGTLVAEPPEDSFPLLNKLVQEYDIRVAIHNHPRPSHYWHPEIELKALAGSDARIGSCCDTGHWARCGLVPIDCLKMLQGHVLTLHLKDTNEIAPGVHDVPFGTGKADVAGQLAEIKRQGFKGYISIEYESAPDVEQRQADMRTCVRFFDATTNALAK
jgi:sugar phosphate isomerase/epimerase